MEENLLKAIEGYIQTKKEIQEIKELIVPAYPKKPIASTLQNWKEYVEKKNEYDKIVEKKSDGFKKLNIELEEIIKYIISALPAPNTWFILDNGKIAVGHRTNDWPSSHGDILIQQYPKIEELKEITHQVVT